MLETIVTLGGVMLAAGALALGMGCLIANTGGLRVNTRWETGVDGQRHLVSDINPILGRVGVPLSLFAYCAGYVSQRNQSGIDAIGRALR